MAAMLPPPLAIADLRDAGIRADELRIWQPAEVLWRVHRTTGGNVLPWNVMRTFGPILRFDHHPLPRAEHRDHGIWYGADNPRGALAESFQSARVIDRHFGDPYLTGLRLRREVRLLDVSGLGGGAWATRVGGNHALDSAAHSRTQHWARAIHRAHDDLDGVIYRAGSRAVRVLPWSNAPPTRFLPTQRCRCPWHIPRSLTQSTPRPSRSAMPSPDLSRPGLKIATTTTQYLLFMLASRRFVFAHTANPADVGTAQ